MLMNRRDQIGLALYPAEWAKTALTGRNRPDGTAFGLSFGPGQRSGEHLLYLAGVWRHRRIRRNAEDIRSALQSAWRFLLHARLDHSSADFRERRRADRSGRPKTSLGNYWKVFAGIVAIIVGLGALNLLPFKIPGVRNRAIKNIENEDFEGQRQSDSS